MGEGKQASWRVSEKRARLKLLPGQDGTKKLTAEYGERLICVRYRYDEEKRKRYKTVELIVEETEWEPRPAKEEIVGVRVAWGERELAWQVKQAGGRWNGERKLWELPYERAKAMGLEKRMVWPGRSGDGSSVRKGK